MIDCRWLRPVSALLTVSGVVLPAVALGAIRVCLPQDEQSVLPYTRVLLEERIGLLADAEVEFIAPGDADAHITLVLATDTGSSAEAYQIRAVDGKITLSSSSAQGMLHGTCGLIEYLMSHSMPDLPAGAAVDIDFPVQRGQARGLLAEPPDTQVDGRPTYNLRGAELQILALGVADLIDTSTPVEKYNPYSGVAGGFPASAEVWKRWCDWLARHRMNFITNWPYSSGTNWWELAWHPDTAGMSPYSREDIEKAAAVREELLAYARSRGLMPYLMNYVPGAPTATIRRNHPEIVGEKFNEAYPEPYDMVNPQTTRMFETQIRAIARQYPSLAGFHLRWWGESFLDPKQGLTRLSELTLAMMRAATDERADLRVLMSGYLPAGGTAELARGFPRGTIIQTKWGKDWEPVPDPGVPYGAIAGLELPVLISQCLPGEEYHSIGSVQYRSTDVGVKKYAEAAGKVPNLSGFPMMTGDLDHHWITGLDCLVLARLNWDPLGTDVPQLVRNYLAVHYGPQIVEPVYRALELTQDAMEQYVHDFAGLAEYVMHYRSHNMFGLKRLMSITPDALQTGLAQVREFERKLMRAAELIDGVAEQVRPSGAESFADLQIQTRWWAEFMRSRRLLAEAFAAKHAGERDRAMRLLGEVARLDEQLVKLGLGKPNIADDFEFEGMTRAHHLRPFVDQELQQIADLKQQWELPQ